MLQPQVGFKYAIIFIMLLCVVDFKNLSITGFTGRDPIDEFASFIFVGPCRS